VLSVSRALLLAGLCLSCARAAPLDLERVRAALEQVRFVAYTPRAFDPSGSLPPPGEASLAADLRLLRARFDGLITYSCAPGLEPIARLAREAGFRAVVLGVWNPGDDRELARALASARAEPRTVLALAIGNEGLFFRRYQAQSLQLAFARVRAESPGTAVTTSEPFAEYLDPEVQRSLPRQDFLLPNVHPTDQPWFVASPPEQSIEFVANVLRDLEARYSLPVLLKETGVPSGPESLGFSEASQLRFWRQLAARLPPTRAHAFAWFEAFDSPWKVRALGPELGERAEREAHWGLLRADGSPKPAFSDLSTR
jgi:exo-beta-1,3-glucanase (GH17 family)